MADQRVTTSAVITDPATSTQQAGVDASGNLTVILAANTGVDIGDVDVTSIIPGTGATNLGKAEDAVHATGDTGVYVLAVRDDVLAAHSGADGDYESLHTNANGALWTIAVPNDGVDIGDVDVTSVVPGTAATNLGKAVDSAAGGTDTGVALLAIRDDALTTLTPIDGDYVNLRVNSTGALHVTGGGGGTEYNEDDATPATIVGTATLMERDDALATLTPIEGDWAAFRCTAEGALWVQDFAINNIDTAVGGTDPGMPVLVQRVDTPSTLTPADGDYVPLSVDSTGRLHVTDPNAGAGTPTNPAFDITNVTTPVNLAAGAGGNADSADLASKRLTQVTISSSVPFKGLIASLANAVATDKAAVMSGPGGGTIIWEPPQKDYVVSGSSAGADGFRVALTNLDANDTADFYVSFAYED